MKDETKLKILEMMEIMNRYLKKDNIVKVIEGAYHITGLSLHEYLNSDSFDFISTKIQTEIQNEEERKKMAQDEFEEFVKKDLEPYQVEILDQLTSYKFNQDSLRFTVELVAGLMDLPRKTTIVIFSENRARAKYLYNGFMNLLDEKTNETSKRLVGE